MAIQTGIYPKALPGGRQTRFAKRIHETIMALDYQLAIAVDGHYRRRLVRAAYSLRGLEEYTNRHEAGHREDFPNNKAARSCGSEQVQGC